MCLRYDIPEFPSPGTPHRANAVCQGWWTEKTTPSDSCRFNIEQHKFGKIKCRKLGKIVCRISGKINAFFSGKVLAVYNFDLNQINPIKVSRRNGNNYVFNGQHTAEIIAAVSGSRDTPVWCMIYDELDYKQEADIFANQMRNVKPLSPYDVFNGHCQAGNDKELMIKGLVESFDLQVSSKSGPGYICAVGALESIYDKYGYEMLERVLRLIVMTWEGEQKSFSANIMNGLARFLYSYQSKVNESIFKEKLGTISIKELTKTAKERKAGSLGFAEAMLIFYNKRLKNPLSWNELYEIRIDRKKRKNAAVEKDEGNENSSSN